ncbi:MAG TPA: DUF3293 domain-containing protein [Rhodopila sp.]|nr:DUF3293 domain-containing protein [Rhodopila sp.]
MSTATWSSPLPGTDDMVPRAGLLTPALLAAYRRTGYHAAGAVIRIGRRAPAVDRLLRCYRCREAALITAWNPFSHRMPPGWNARMQRHLRQAVRRYVVLPANGGARGWSEEHLLVLMPPARAAVLARRFRQNAIVNLKYRQPPCLTRAY